MRDKLNVVEVDRRPDQIRDESVRRRDERGHLDRQLTSLIRERRRAWEQGFAAAMDLMAHQQETRFARGTRDFGDEDTAPYPIVDPTLIEAD